jgi:hypothetical protein
MNYSKMHLDGTQELVEYKFVLLLFSFVALLLHPPLTFILPSWQYFFKLSRNVIFFLLFYFFFFFLARCFVQTWYNNILT